MLPVLVVLIILALVAASQFMPSISQVERPKDEPNKPSNLTVTENQYILLEAESAKEVVLPMTIGRASEESCSEGAFLEIPLQDPRGSEKVKGSAIVPFRVAVPGKYLLHARCWWFDNCGNSFSVSIDDSNSLKLTDSTLKHWHWVALQKRPFLLTAGEHQLVVANSEDGARIDQIMLTNDPEYVPQGIE